MTAVYKENRAATTINTIDTIDAIENAAVKNVYKTSQFEGSFKRKNKYVRQIQIYTLLR